jgi:hypothetical protein
LDEHFTSETRTPLPGSLVTRTATEQRPLAIARERPAPPQSEVTAAVERIRAEIDRRSWASAEMLVYVAQAELGSLDVFTRLLGEIEAGCASRDLEAAQGRADALVGQAEVLLRIEETAAARRKLRQALELDPENARALALLQQCREP